MHLVKMKSRAIPGRRSPLITTFHGHLRLDALGTNALTLAVSTWGQQVAQPAGHVKQPR